MSHADTTPISPRSLHSHRRENRAAAERPRRGVPYHAGPRDHDGSRRTCGDRGNLRLDKVPVPLMPPEAVPAATNGIVYAVNNRQRHRDPDQYRQQTPPSPRYPSAARRRHRHDAQWPDGLRRQHRRRYGDPDQHRYPTPPDRPSPSVSSRPVWRSRQTERRPMWPIRATTRSHRSPPPASTPATPIPVGKGPLAIAVTPNGQTAYVANSRGRDGHPDQDGDQHRRAADRSGQRALCDSRHARWHVPLRRQLSRQLGHRGVDGYNKVVATDPGRHQSRFDRHRAEWSDRLCHQLQRQNHHAHRHGHQPAKPVITLPGNPTRSPSGQAERRRTSLPASATLSCRSIWRPARSRRPSRLEATPTPSPSPLTRRRWPRSPPRQARRASRLHLTRPAQVHRQAGSRRISGTLVTARARSARDRRSVTSTPAAGSSRPH